MHSPDSRKRSWLAGVRYRKYKDGEGEAGRGYDEGSETGINAADYAGE